MSITAMHKIEPLHSLREIDRTHSETGTLTITEQCCHCGAQKLGIELGHISNTSLGSSAWVESSAFSRDTLERWQAAARSMMEEFEQLVFDTPYDNIDAVFNEIKALCQGVVHGSQLPYRQLKIWISSPKRFKVRNLLELAQGPACNRCDRLFSHQVPPTLDHINGDRSNAYPSNLQILCKDCNGDKGSNPPDDRDQSPFTYQGASCGHRLSCVELHSLQMDYENAKDELT